MTATEELRRMLDERGIEYRIAFDGATEWDSCAGDYSSAVDVGDGKLVFTGCITPSQAVDATFGRGTCRQVIEKCDDGLLPPFIVHCSECGGTWGYTPNYCPNCGRNVER